MRVSYLAFAALMTVPSAVSAAETVNVPAFRGIELSNGGEVVVRRGAVQRITIVEGSTRNARFTVRDSKLSIVNCPNRCTERHRLRVEITTPSILAVAVSNGGMLRAEGFPVQDSVAAAVDNGGVVDARALPGVSVAAAVSNGGRVLVTARTNLAASVKNGGIVTYWGDPSSIAKSSSNGGAITRGTLADARRPVSDMAPRPPAPPQAIPAVPPVPDVNDPDEDDMDGGVESYDDADEDSDE